MLQAQRDNIIVKKYRETDKQSSLIIAPDNNNYAIYEAPEICEIVHIGEDYDQVYLNNKQLERGDIVICEHIEGVKLLYKGSTLWRMKGYNVLARVEKEFMNDVATYIPTVSDIEWERAKEHFTGKGVKVT
jgi:co-chaperonin GroES (HSP10)